MPEPDHSQAIVRNAEEKLRQALESYHRAGAEYQQKGMDYAERQQGELEEVVSACLQMNIQRGAVEAARLRLKLLGAGESVLEIELEDRRRHRTETAPGEHIDDLGTLEDAERDLLETDARRREAEVTHRATEIVRDRKNRAGRYVAGDPRAGRSRR